MKLFYLIIFSLYVSFTASLIDSNIAIKEKSFSSFTLLKKDQSLVNEKIFESETASFSKAYSNKNDISSKDVYPGFLKKRMLGNIHTLHFIQYNTYHLFQNFFTAKSSSFQRKFFIKLKILLI
jgi:hypothetical protein